MRLVLDLLRGLAGYEDSLGKAERKCVKLMSDNYNMEQRALRAEERCTAWRDAAEDLEQYLDDSYPQWHESITGGKIEKKLEAARKLEDEE